MSSENQDGKEGNPEKNNINQTDDTFLYFEGVVSESQVIKLKTAFTSIDKYSRENCQRRSEEFGKHGDLDNNEKYSPASTSARVNIISL